MGVIRSLALPDECLVIPTFPNDAFVAFWACLPLAGRDVAENFVYIDTFNSYIMLYYLLQLTDSPTGYNVLETFRRRS